jgi:hypothetical protein
MGVILPFLEPVLEPVVERGVLLPPPPRILLLLLARELSRDFPLPRSVRGGNEGSEEDAWLSRTWSKEDEERSMTPSSISLGTVDGAAV